MKTKKKKTKGMKFDTGKLRWDLLPLDPIREVIKVFVYGSKKYDDFNWENVVSEPNGKQRYYNASLRHITDYWQDNKSCDKESKLHHLAHGICCLLILLWKELREKR